MDGSPSTIARKSAFFRIQAVHVLILVMMVAEPRPPIDDGHLAEKVPRRSRVIVFPLRDRDALPPSSTNSSCPFAPSRTIVAPGL